MTTLSMPGQSRIVLDLLSLPVGYFFLYRLFGVAAIVVSIGANVGISTLAARVGKQKTVAGAWVFISPPRSFDPVHCDWNFEKKRGRSALRLRGCFLSSASFSFAVKCDGYRVFIPPHHITSSDHA